MECWVDGIDSLPNSPSLLYPNIPFYGNFEIPIRELILLKYIKLYRCLVNSCICLPWSLRWRSIQSANNGLTTNKWVNCKTHWWALQKEFLPLLRSGLTNVLAFYVPWTGGSLPFHPIYQVFQRFLYSEIA